MSVVAASTQTRQPLRVVYLGTYDKNRTRNRLLIDALRRVSVEVSECQCDIWGNVSDKSRNGMVGLMRKGVSYLWAYAVLYQKYLRLPPHDAVIIGYMGHFDVIALKAIVRLRTAPLIWDAFLSLYDTVVEDRKILAPRHPLARILRCLESLACRLSDRILLDTRTHARLFSQLYGVPARRLGTVWVGALEERFPRLSPKVAGNPPTALFYGHFIPLHGISTIVKAIQLQQPPLRWVIIGTGQEDHILREALRANPDLPVEWIPHVPHEHLVNYIARADVCLGIFGCSEKAARVIPHKVFEVLAAGRPLVTRDSPAIRELIETTTPGVRLVPPGDAAALREAVMELAASGERPPAELREKFSTEAIGRHLHSVILDVCAERKTSR